MFLHVAANYAACVTSPDAARSTDLKRKARTAITAKMARVIYALIKHGQAYRQRFDVDLPSGSIPLRRAVEAFGTS